MKTFEDKLIEQAFEKCYGLKDSLQKYIKEKDKKMYHVSIGILHSYTGLRTKFLTSKFPYDGNS